jgi:hypothetical protein
MSTTMADASILLTTAVAGNDMKTLTLPSTAHDGGTACPSTVLVEYFDSDTNVWVDVTSSQAVATYSTSVSYTAGSGSLTYDPAAIYSSILSGSTSEQDIIWRFTYTSDYTSITAS